MNPYGVHNYFLDIAFASGLPALLLFYGLFCSPALKLLYEARTPLALATLLALSTYLLYGMFWFATQNVDPLIWALVGLGIGSVPDAPSREAVKPRQTRGLEAAPSR